MGCFGSAQNKNLENQINNQTKQIQQIISAQNQIIKQLQSSQIPDDSKFHESLLNEITQVKTKIGDLTEELKNKKSFHSQNFKTTEKIIDTKKLNESDFESDQMKVDLNQAFIDQENPNGQKSNGIKQYKLGSSDILNDPLLANIINESRLYLETGRPINEDTVKSIKEHFK